MEWNLPDVALDMSKASYQSRLETMRILCAHWLAYLEYDNAHPR